MRRIPRASGVGDLRASAGIGMLLAAPGLARREPGAPDIAALVAAIANVNQKLQELGADIQAQQESVNKAIVDVQTARDNAATAPQRGRRQQARRRRRRRRDHLRAAQVRHLRRVHLCQRAVEFVSDRRRPRRHHRHGLRRTDACHQRTAGRHRSAAGAHRTGQQGVRGPAREAEGRPGHRGRAGQPGRRRVGAEVGPADFRRRSRPSSTG